MTTEDDETAALCLLMTPSDFPYLAMVQAFADYRVAITARLKATRPPSEVDEFLEDYPGFIPHYGGPCPVDPESKPSIICRDGWTSGACVASGWMSNKDSHPNDWWQWQCRQGDRIVGYKPEV